MGSNPSTYEADLTRNPQILKLREDAAHNDRGAQLKLLHLGAITPDELGPLALILFCESLGGVVLEGNLSDFWKTCGALFLPKTNEPKPPTALSGNHSFARAAVLVR